MPATAKRLLAALLSLAILGFVGVAASGSAAAKPKNTGGTLTAPVTGAADDGTTFAGTFSPDRFAVQDGGLVAIGDVTGTLSNPDGTTDPVTTQATLPVDLAQSSGSCQILDLTLGPLDLDLLGLVVHLDEVHLNITAQQGPGNLLGNLLCAVAGLLDGPTGLNAILTQIAGLLNQILGLLG